ncbi:MAG: hypothetical protein DHS20C18_04840 [Saprospiraceae bacterium]|nr:MAG: hypothetical protein DHS20C18_04840 [Saprospiraceae bacterium]
MNVQSKTLNLSEFKLKMAAEDSSKQELLDQLAGGTLATCHDEILICCISKPGDGGTVG